ncbi:GH3 auxin-responsive promoter [Leptolyngbya sp. 'hensonii']|nr:GH3 auxin-responsive promoter [Leptolyngbya sp. 'hensonii']
MALAPVAQGFHQALEHPQQAQGRVQRQICDRLLASQYGQALGVQSVADWSQIPIVDYDEMAPWIQRQQGNTAPILTPEPILFYEKTSGSRGPAKWIPYTRSLRRSFNHLFCIWAHDLLSHGPPFASGKAYFCISPQLNDPPSGDLSIGLADDSEYLDPWLRWLLKPFLVMPPGLTRLQDPEQFKHQLCLALLQDVNLEIISIWSPSFLQVLLHYIQAHRTELQSELQGKLSPDRLGLLGASPLPWTTLWPKLKLISCWDSVHAADRAAVLRQLFPDVLVQGKGLLATEAPITVPLIQARGFLPLLDEVFLEFADADNRIHLLHELEMGTPYSVILSQKGGLYRYRLGDRVRATHQYKATPCLEFLGRDQPLSDLVGEKLHEDFVRDVLTTLDLPDTSYQSLVSVLHPTPHYVLLLDRASQPPENLARTLDRGLCQSYQYRQARHLGQLTAAQVIVSETIAATIVQVRLQQGQKWGDVKHPLLLTTPLPHLPRDGQ